MSETLLLWVGALITAFGALRGNPVIAIPGVLVLIVTGTARLWTSKSFTRRLSCKFQLAHHTSTIRGLTDAVLVVKNDQPFPVFWLECRLDWPKHVKTVRTPLDASYRINRLTLSYILSLRWFERVTKRVQIQPELRGEYGFGPIELVVTDPFGLLRVSKTLPEQTRLVVHPRVVPVRLTSSVAQSLFGQKARTSWVYEDPACFRGAREYTPQDPFSRIEWKATARTQELHVRQVDASFDTEMAIFLDVTSVEKVWDGIRKDWVERTIVVAASLLRYALDSGFRVGMYTNSLVPNQPGPASIRAGSGSAHFLACMNMLGRIVDVPAYGAESVLRQLGNRLGRASVLVVTPLFTDRLIRQVEHLYSTGKHVALVFTCPDGMPRTSRAPVYSVDEKEQWDELKAISLSRTRC